MYNVVFRKHIDDQYAELTMHSELNCIRFEQSVCTAIAGRFCTTAGSTQLAVASQIEDRVSSHLYEKVAHVHKRNSQEIVSPFTTAS